MEKIHAGRDWRQEEKGTTEDEVAGWHHRLNGHEFVFYIVIKCAPGAAGDFTCADPPNARLTTKTNFEKLKVLNKMPE